MRTVAADGTDTPSEDGVRKDMTPPREETGAGRVPALRTAPHSSMTID